MQCAAGVLQPGVESAPFTIGIGSDDLNSGVPPWSVATLFPTPGGHAVEEAALLPGE